MKRPKVAILHIIEPFVSVLIDHKPDGDFVINEDNWCMFYSLLAYAMHEVIQTKKINKKKLLTIFNGQQLL